MKIELGGVYQTRYGLSARVLAVDAKGTLPVVALVKTGRVEVVQTYHANGLFRTTPGDAWDLMPRVATYVVDHWFPVWRTTDGSAYHGTTSFPSKAAALAYGAACATNNRAKLIGAVNVTGKLEYPLDLDTTPGTEIETETGK